MFCISFFVKSSFKRPDIRLFISYAYPMDGSPRFRAMVLGGVGLAGRRWGLSLAAITITLASLLWWSVPILNR